MPAVHHDPLKVPFVVDDAVNQNAHAGKGEKEGDRGDEHAAAGPVRNGGAHQEPEAG